SVWQPPSKRWVAQSSAAIGQRLGAGQPFLDNGLPGDACGRVRSDGGEEVGSLECVELPVGDPSDRPRARNVSKQRDLAEVVAATHLAIRTVGEDVELAVRDD